MTSFHALVATRFSTKLQSIQCDNGREFDNIMLHTLTNTHGVHIRFLCPYTSQQNGKAERVICTVNDIVRTLLFQASMPPRFWVEALHATTYLLNRLPTKTISDLALFSLSFALHPPTPTYRSSAVSVTLT